MSKESKMNLAEATDLLEFIIKQNYNLASENKKTTAIEFIGESGIGKTSALLDIAKKLDMYCVKLNLAQIEELGDLIGYPIKEYYMCSPEGICEWIASDVLEHYISAGYKLHENQSRMSYALPSWVPREENPNGTLLLLDDFNRADPRMIQATMELIDRGQYVSWSLPPKTTIVLSSNPDNGDYSVSTLDNAQKTRYMSFSVDFDIEVWAKWAEFEGLDSRTINFALSNPEIFKKQGGVQTVNARSYTTFANTIAGFKDFSTRETLSKILNIASGCFTNENNTVGTLFTAFIANKLDKLTSPKEMLLTGWDTLKVELTSCLYDGNNYRADIANVLSTRFLNYVEFYFDQPNCKSDVVIKRMLDFIDSDVVLLSEDLIFHLVKNLTTKYPQRTNKLLMNPKVISKLL